ncbi:MAG: glycosyltransferase family 4 protein [Thermoanaerobaculia bacterium]
MTQEPSSRSGGPIRILGVTKSTGGLATYNRTLLEQLQDRGYSVSVVCLSEGSGAYARAFAKREIPATSMDMARYTIAPFSDLKLAIRLVRHLRRNPVDLVIAHGAKAGFLGRLAGRVTGARVLYVLHSMPFLERVQGRRAIFYRSLERIGRRMGGHIVAISHAMRDEIEKHGIAPASAVTVLHTGIDPSALAIPRDQSSARMALGLDPRRPVVGWAGRLNPQKAPLDFIRAAELVTRSVPEAQFFMAGEGSLASTVRALANKLGLGDRLILAGWQEDAARMLSALDVYVATSWWEGLPLTLLEAMCGERAVVATAVDGVVEVIRDGVDGFLVDAGDPPAMAARLELLLRDDGRRSELGRAARRRVMEHFTVDRMMDRWVKLICRELAALQR